MTQQYIVGQFSVLLEGLQPPPGRWSVAIDELRRTVELAPVPMLPRLAHQALDLADLVCWAALEQGDMSCFCGAAKTAVALGEFLDNARLLSE